MLPNLNCFDHGIETFTGTETFEQWNVFFAGTSITSLPVDDNKRNPWFLSRVENPQLVEFGYFAAG